MIILKQIQIIMKYANCLMTVKNLVGERIRNKSFIKLWSTEWQRNNPQKLCTPSNKEFLVLLRKIILEYENEAQEWTETESNEPPFKVSGDKIDKDHRRG